MVAAQTLAYVLGLTLPFLPTTSASWPFSQRKYVAESIADIGSLGLQDVGGRVAAMADWDGDQK
jgi:integrin alpha FG-GAP repeat containing protein 1